jgi:thioredoxin-dependent peroxiredoxin
MQTGRNFTEMLRAVDSIQLTTRHPVATPASWQPGEDVMVALMVSDDKAKVLYGDFKAPKPYIRIIPEPT